MNKRHTVKFQNFSYITLEPPRVETEKDLVLAAVGDLKKSGIKMSAKQQKEVEDFLKRYK